MFSILSSFRSKRPVQSRNTYRPAIEVLEERWCPDGSHITLSTLAEAGHLVNLSGTVTGGQVAGISVMFSGAVNGGTFTDSNGNYSYTTSSASLGSVSVVGTDAFMNSTDTAQANIAVPAPSVTLSIASVSGKNVTLTGTLTDIDASGRTISISGVASGSATTDSSGNFTLTTLASALGTISAVETDLWGQTSNTASTTLNGDTPIIQNFAAVHGIGDMWTFTGSVSDGAGAAGLTVTFGGLASLAGHTTTVAANGTFSFTCSINPADIPDTATAFATGWWGQDSAVVNYQVS